MPSYTRQSTFTIYLTQADLKVLRQHNEHILSRDIIEVINACDSRQSLDISHKGLMALRDVCQNPQHANSDTDDQYRQSLRVLFEVFNNVSNNARFCDSVIIKENQ